MGSYRITGGLALKGTIHVSGNKNAALPCLAATLLTNKPVVLRNVPHIEDVHAMIRLLEHVGSRIAWTGPGSLEVCPDSTNDGPAADFPRDVVGAIRASILLAGPLIATRRQVQLPPPGGDVIGLRRLDTHFSALEALGCECTVNPAGDLVLSCASGPRGADVFLEEASVTGTENLLMAAARATGTTVIRNAASEPHVQDLCRMLTLMGAHIDGIGSNLVRITGAPDGLDGCDFTLGPDYMEAGSYIGLAAATGSEVRLEGLDPLAFPMMRSAFNRIGIDWTPSGPSSLVVPACQSRCMRKDIGGMTAKIDDAPWPGFPADLLSILTVVATQMHGSVLIHEKMYESRMFFVDWLIRMGADIILCDPHRAVVNGPTQLKPAVVSSPDVRAGMALVIAALCADGVSTIQNIYQIERGYESLQAKLLALGAKIEQVG